MIYFITLLTFITILTAPLKLYALNYSSQTPKGVNITSFVIDQSDQIMANHYLCLGQNWSEINVSIEEKISNLKSSYPNLLSNLSKSEVNCFSPYQTSDSAKSSIDLILNEIDQYAADQLHLAVNDEGLPILNKDKSLGKKLLRAQAVIGGAEVVGMGILIALPRSITKWEKDWMSAASKNLKRAWSSSPVWDKDDWAINYIGHPLAGAAYYNILRSQGATRLQSALFSTLQSTIWEYGIEAIAEQPSIQDLIITPVAGSIIGELAHLQTNRMRKNGFTFGEKVLVTLINPSYVINNGFKTKKKKPNKLIIN